MFAELSEPGPLKVAFVNAGYGSHGNPRWFQVYYGEMNEWRRQSPIRAWGRGLSIRFFSTAEYEVGLPLLSAAHPLKASTRLRCRTWLGDADRYRSYRD